MNRDKMIHDAKLLIKAGDSAASVARTFGKTITTIRRWTDPEYCEHRKRKINERRRARKQA